MVKAYSNSAYSSYDGYVEAMQKVYEKELEKLSERRAAFDSGVPYFKFDGSAVTSDDHDEELKDLQKTKIDFTVQSEHVSAKVIVDTLVDAGYSLPEISWNSKNSTVVMGWYSDVVEVTVKVYADSTCEIRQMDFVTFDEQVVQSDVMSAVGVVQPFLEVFEGNE